MNTMPSRHSSTRTSFRHVRSAENTSSNRQRQNPQVSKIRTGHHEHSPKCPTPARVPANTSPVIADERRSQSSNYGDRPLDIANGESSVTFQVSEPAKPHSPIAAASVVKKTHARLSDGHVSPPNRDSAHTTAPLEANTFGNSLSLETASESARRIYPLPDNSPKLRICQRYALPVASSSRLSRMPLGSFSSVLFSLVFISNCAQ